MMAANKQFKVGAQCEMLYKDLESVVFDISEMFSEPVFDSLSKVSKSMFCPHFV